MIFGKKATVGLDIGSSMVKVVQLKKAGRGIDLEKFAMEPIFAGREKKSAGPELKEQKIAATRRALEMADISAKYAISSVSGESIIVRYIQLPEMPENELKNALRWEAEEYIPFRIDEVNLDSVILGKAEGNEGKVDVLLVSAKKDLINEHLDIIKEVGLTPSIVDVDSFAFLNCFELNHAPDPSEVIALVNIGAEITNINVYVNGTSRFSRDISIAGDTITNAIAGKMNVDFPKAESLKISEGAPPVEEESAAEGVEDSGLISTIRGTVEKITGEDLGEDAQDMITQKVIRNNLQNLISEISRSIQFFENQSTGKNVERVVVGGGTSKMKNIIPFFSRELGLPVEIIDPLRRINVKDSMRSDVSTIQEMLGVGIGLALRKVVD